MPVTNHPATLEEQLTFISEEYQGNLDTYTRLQQEFGEQRASEWGTGLQEKIRLLSAVRESLKELIYFKGIRP